MRGWLLIAVLASCGGADPAVTPKEEAAAPGVAAAPAGAAACAGPEVGPARGWRHKRNSAVSTLLGDPAHAAGDPMVNPGSSAQVEGKFAYGTVSKDLQDEDVTLWLQVSCGRWLPVTTARTDGDGRARFAIDAARIPVAGAYPFELVVHGDGSRAQGHIYVVPRGQPAVLFDVDGTLTTGDDQARVLGGDAGSARARSTWSASVAAGHMPST
jgi:hypothetical protein